VAKIGIVRCEEYSHVCAGYNCFPAMRNKTGQMAQYEDVELVGFDTCGGCARNSAGRIVERSERLKAKGAETIHLAHCLVTACPWTDLFRRPSRNRWGCRLCAAHISRGRPRPIGAD
jgi:predicted metal-binding protein